MISSVECRVPFLDKPLIDLALGAEPGHKIGGGWTKRFHRDAMRGLLMDEVRLRRSKIGFEPPEDEWLRAARGLVTLGEVRDAVARYVPELAELVERLWGVDEAKLSRAELRLLWRGVQLALWLRWLNKLGA